MTRDSKPFVTSPCAQLFERFFVDTNERAGTLRAVDAKHVPVLLASNVVTAIGERPTTYVPLSFRAWLILFCSDGPDNRKVVYALTNDLSGMVGASALPLCFHVRSGESVAHGAGNTQCRHCATRRALSQLAVSKRDGRQRAQHQAGQGARRPHCAVLSALVGVSGQENGALLVWSVGVVQREAQETKESKEVVSEESSKKRKRRKNKDSDSAVSSGVSDSSSTKSEAQHCIERCLAVLQARQVEVPSAR